MKSNLVKRFIAVAAVTTLSLGAMTGCQSASAQTNETAADSTGAESDAAEAESADTEVKKVVIGVVNDADRFGFVDESGELDGYEVQLLKAIDEKLDDYEFEFQGLDFNNILLSLDTGKIDLGTHMLEYNEERGQKYYFSNQGIINFSTYFIVPIDSDATTWEGLAGKVFGTIGETDNSAIIVNKYNEENPDKAITLDYFGQIGDEAIVKSLLEGRFDATLGLWWTADEYNAEFGNGQDIVKKGDAIGTSLAYYMFPKDDEHAALRDAVDGALEELKSEGKLTELSEQYFGFDISPAENVTPGQN